MPDGLFDWLIKVVVPAAFGAAGYLARSWLERSEKRRQERTSKLEKEEQERASEKEKQRQIRASIISKLEELRKLLNASDELFDIQQTKMKELMKELGTNHPAEYQQGTNGYEATIERCYGVMNTSEKTLHGIIRAYTEFSIRPVNDAVANWLRADQLFLTGSVMYQNSEDLTEKLRLLEIHLLLWRAKYEYWIPNKPEHALVYMADENAHGLGFPPGTDDAVKSALDELRK